jgi:Fic-DOC domain mobile mystery protein B
VRSEDATGTTPLDENEAAGLVPTHISTQAELNEWEQANILEAYKWLRERRRFTVVADLLTDAFARELHKRMFGLTWEWAGTYRTSDKSIGVHWPGIAEQLRNSLADALHWIGSAVFADDEIAVRLHHRLVQIHPFPNGNGRHGRLFVDTVLIALGRRPFSWGGRAADLQRAGDVRSTYIDALRSADAGDVAPLLSFVRR